MRYAIVVSVRSVGRWTTNHLVALLSSAVALNGIDDDEMPV